MISIVIQKIFDKILKFQNGLFSVELFNNQYNTIKEELPLITPACLIELDRLEFVTSGIHTQEADLTLRLHLVFDNFQDTRLSIKERDLEILNIVQQFTQYFNGFQVHENSNFYTAEFIRKSLQLDFQHEQYKIIQLEFVSRIFDDSLNLNKKYSQIVYPDLEIKKSH